MTQTIESLYAKALESLAAYYNMFKKGYITSTEWEARREMTFGIFFPEQTSEQREAFAAALEAEVAKAEENK